MYLLAAQAPIESKGGVMRIVFDQFFIVKQLKKEKTDETKIIFMKRRERMPRL
ncbi:MAG: hypothetical protein HFE59_02140 [Clostridiales bacterium]|nr:hypothetical protein [Clostridiales bacterium]